MRVAVIGSRGLVVKHLQDYLPPDTTEIVSGGARGIDACARSFATSYGLTLTEFLPDYERHGAAAPLLRNVQIIEHSDLVLAFWDGESRGTRFVIDTCKQRGVEVWVLRGADGRFERAGGAPAAIQQRMELDDPH